MEETQETNTTSLLTSNIDNISTPDPIIDKPILENESESNSAVQINSFENIFDQLRENNKHIFVLSIAGKPIYTR